MAAIINKEIRLKGSKGEAFREAIFDPGATYSRLSPKLAEKLEVMTPLPEPMEFATAEEGRTVLAQGAVRLNFYIGEYRFSDEFSDGVIIGAATLQKWRLKLDFEHDEIIVDPKVTKLWLRREDAIGQGGERENLDGIRKG